MKLIESQKYISLKIKLYVVNKDIEITVVYRNTGQTHIAMYNRGHYLWEWTKETRPTLVELKKEVLHEASFYLEV